MGGIYVPMEDKTKEKPSPEISLSRESDLASCLGVEYINERAMQSNVLRGKELRTSEFL